MANTGTAALRVVFSEERSSGKSDSAPRTRDSSFRPIQLCFKGEEILSSVRLKRQSALRFTGGTYAPDQIHNDKMGLIYV